MLFVRYSACCIFDIRYACGNSTFSTFDILGSTCVGYRIQGDKMGGGKGSKKGDSGEGPGGKYTVAHPASGAPKSDRVHAGGVSHQIAYVAVSRKSVAESDEQVFDRVKHNCAGRMIMLSCPKGSHDPKHMLICEMVGEFCSTKMTEVVKKNLGRQCWAQFALNPFDQNFWSREKPLRCVNCLDSDTLGLMQFAFDRGVEKGKGKNQKREYVDSLEKDGPMSKKAKLGGSDPSSSSRG